MTEGAIDAIQKFYVDLRSSSVTIPFTARALESMVRLTEAAARARLSTSATEQDADLAIRLYTHALKGVGWNDETQSFDIDIINVGSSQTQQERMRKVLQIIRDLTKEVDGRPSYPDEASIVAEAASHGIEEKKVRDALRVLSDRGSVYMPNHGRYAATT